MQLSSCSCAYETNLVSNQKARDSQPYVGIVRLPCVPSPRQLRIVKDVPHCLLSVMPQSRFATNDEVSAALALCFLALEWVSHYSTGSAISSLTAQLSDPADSTFKSLSGPFQSCHPACLLIDRSGPVQTAPLRTKIHGKLSTDPESGLLF